MIIDQRKLRKVNPIHHNVDMDAVKEDAKLLYNIDHNASHFTAAVRSLDVGS